MISAHDLLHLSEEISPKLLLSFSGPSSSGKTELLSKYSQFFLSSGISSETRPSISRTSAQNVPTEVRASPKFQFMMLRRAFQIESTLLQTSSARVFLFDRTTLDGYLFFRNYLRSQQSISPSFSERMLLAYLRRALKMTKLYTASFLLQRVVFHNTPGVHVRNDEQFSTSFVDQLQEIYKEHSPVPLRPLILLPPIFGIQKVFEMSLEYLFEHLTHLKKDHLF